MSSNNFFTTDNQGNETFTNEFVRREPVNLIAGLLTLAIIHGIDRVEKAVKNTYAKPESTQIISLMNMSMDAATS